MTASAAAGTDRVLVRTIGVSMVPISSTWVTPHELAEAVGDRDGAGHFVLKEIAVMGQDGRHSGSDVLVPG